MTLEAGLQFIVHRTIGLTGYIGPLTLALTLFGSSILAPAPAGPALSWTPPSYQVLEYTLLCLHSVC